MVQRNGGADIGCVFVRSYRLNLLTIILYWPSHLALHLKAIFRQILGATLIFYVQSLLGIYFSLAHAEVDSQMKHSFVLKPKILTSQKSM